MILPDRDDAAACATCGSPWTDVDGGRSWVHLEVTRHDEGGEFRFVDADFCSQQHAAQWLARPLPDPAPPAPEPMTWQDRLAVAWVVALLLLVAALTGLGVWTAGRFVVDLF